MLTALNTRRIALTIGITVAVVVGIAAVGPGRGFAFQTRKPVGAPFGAFSIAQNLAVDQATGNIFATDGGSDETVNVYGPEGGPPIGGIPTQLSGALTPAGSFKFSTAGVVVDNTCYLRELTNTECASTDPSDGDIYVSDGSDEVVDKFRVNGSNEFEFICEFGGHGGIAGTSCLPEGGEPTTRFNEPWGLAIDGEGDLYVTDWGSEAIYEYNNKGEELASFSSPLMGRPEYVAVDPNGTVYGQSYYPFNNIVQFKRSSPTGPVEGEPVVIANGKGGIAYDPVAHHVIYESNGIIQESDAEGEITGSFPQSLFENGAGVAYAQTSERVYAIESAENKPEIQAFGPRLIVPDVTTVEASDIQPNAATLHGTVNPLGIAATFYAEYGKTQAYGFATVAAPAGEANEQTSPVQAEAHNLAPNTTYHYRFVGENQNGKGVGDDRTFTTVAISPEVGQISASGITRDGALLHSTVNPEAAATTYHFACVEEGNYRPGAGDPYAYGGTTEPLSVGSKFETVEVDQVVAGLKPATTYHCAIVAVNEAGVTIGADQTFTSGPVTPPAALTGEPSGVSQNSATVSGTVDSDGLATTYGFEIGTGAGYGPPTGLGGIGAGESHANVSLALTGLVPGTTYHYRLVATSIDGTSYGADQTFTTSLFSSVFAIPPVPLPFLSTPQIAFPKPPSSHAIKRHKKKPVHKRLHRKPKRKKKK